MGQYPHLFIPPHPLPSPLFCSFGAYRGASPGTNAQAAGRGSTCRHDGGTGPAREHDQRGTHECYCRDNSGFSTPSSGHSCNARMERHLHTSSMLPPRRQAGSIFTCPVPKVRSSSYATRPDKAANPVTRNQEPASQSCNPSSCVLGR